MGSMLMFQKVTIIKQTGSPPTTLTTKNMKVEGGHYLERGKKSVRGERAVAV